MTHDVILSYYYYIMRNHISQQKLRETPFLESSNYHSSYHQSKDNYNTWCYNILASINHYSWYHQRKDNYNTWCYNILASSKRKDNYNTWCYNIFAGSKRKDNFNTWCYNILATIQKLRENYPDGERMRDRKWKREFVRVNE